MNMYIIAALAVVFSTITLAETIYFFKTNKTFTDKKLW